MTDFGRESSLAEGGREGEGEKRERERGGERESIHTKADWDRQTAWQTVTETGKYRGRVPEKRKSE